MTLTERAKELMAMDFYEKSKKERMEESVIESILAIAENEQEQEKYRSTFEICCELLMKNVKLYKRSLISKSEYNLRRNTIEKIMF